jgi:MFS family permease
MSTRYSKDPLIEKSLHHATRDGIAWAVMAGSGESFFSAFALFLKATTEQIALLASLPSLLGSVAQFLSTWLLFHSQLRKRLILIGVLVQAGIWFAILCLPVLPSSQMVTIFILGVMIYYAAGHFASPVWNSLMGDLVPERRRGRFFAKRTALINIAMLIAVTVAGFLLHWFEAQAQVYWGFMVIFGIAGIARFYSAYQISCMYEPEVAEWLPLHGQLQGLWHSEFLRFSVFFALLNFAVAIASPFFSVYMLQDLHFSYLEYSINNASFMLMQFFTLAAWGRLMDTFGSRLVLIVTAIIIATLPAWWAMYANYWYFVGLQMLGGLCWAGFSLAASNFLYDTVTREKRAAYSAVHHTIAAIGVFLGASLGGYLTTHLPSNMAIFGYDLANHSPIAGVFIISTLMRLGIVLAFLPLLGKLRPLRPLSLKSVTFCLWRFKGWPKLGLEMATLWKQK